MSTYWLWNSASKGHLDNSLDSWKQEIKYQKKIDSIENI